MKDIRRPIPARFPVPGTCFLFLEYTSPNMLSCTVSFVNDMWHYIPQMTWSVEHRSIPQALSDKVMEAAWELTKENVYSFLENGAMHYAAAIPEKTSHVAVNGTDVDLTVRWQGPLKDPSVKAELLKDSQARINQFDWVDTHKRTEGSWMRAMSSEKELALP
jgi:hypothetical protein